jgi:hypothetical protein
MWTYLSSINEGGDTNWRLLRRTFWHYSMFETDTCTAEIADKSICHKDRYSKSNTTENILLLRSFIHTAYLRSLQLHVSALLSRPSSGWLYILFQATVQYAIISLWYLTRSRFHREITTTPHTIQSLRHWPISTVKQNSPVSYPPPLQHPPSFINFIAILKFAIFNIQMNKKFYRWKRDLVRYQRLNL